MWRDRFPDSITAAIQETFHGGRTECRIRKVAVPGTYLDFMSQYPTVFVLMGMWSYVISEDISWESVRPPVLQDFVDRISLQDLFQPAIWRRLHAIVFVDPQDDLLPTRARYGGGAVFNVAINYRSGTPQYWTLADVVASKIATGKSPRILGGYRFEPQGSQTSLKPIRIANDDRFVIQPNEDLIKRMVELRAELKSAGRDRSSSSDLFASAAQAVKIAANSIAYGSAIEMNLIEHNKRPELQVYLPDGTSYDVRPARSERPGEWFNPLVATLVSSGGRLLLAMAIASVAELGGRYAMCDTDSLFVISAPKETEIDCRGGDDDGSDRSTIAALSWPDVDSIRARFTSLNPYSGPLGNRSILELEPTNFDSETGKRMVIEAMCIASKRYALFIRASSGRPQLLERKEHGLGHLMPPMLESRVSHRNWIDDWWEHALCKLLGVPTVPPVWFALPAVSRLAISSPREERAFGKYNEGLPYSHQIRPSNFIIAARPHPQQVGPSLLVAPFEQSSEAWLTLDWYDRSASDGRPYRLRVDNPALAQEGEVAVQSFGDYFDEFLLHPESKSADFDGGSCHTWTSGVLGHRYVLATKVNRIGKEANRLSELTHSAEGRSIVSYGTPRDCLVCGERLSGTRSFYCSPACKQKAYRQRLSAFTEWQP